MDLLENNENSLKEILELYITELEMNGFSKNTVKTYIMFINYFLSFLENKNKSLEELDRKILKEFLLKIYRQKKYKQKSVYNLILALKSFLRFLEREDLVKTLKLPKIPKSLPKALSKEEIKKMLNSCKNDKEKLIFLLLYSTGLRVSELANLKLEDINLKDKFLVVRGGKGKKDRIIPLNDKIIELINSHLKNRKKNSDYLINNKFGGKISTVYLEKIIREIGKRVGLKVTCHMLRHSFATHMLENGADIRVIQEILGHERLSTTQIYTKITTKYLKEVYSKFNPLTNL